MIQEDHYSLLREHLFTSLAEPDATFLLWGVSDVTLRLIADIRVLGMESRVLGIVDHRPDRVAMRIADWSVLSPSDIVSLCPRFLLIGLDEEKEEALGLFARHSPAAPEVLMAGSAHYVFRDSTFTRLVTESYVKSHAGGYSNMLIHLYQTIRYVSQHGLQGDVAEFGVYKAGTTVFLAKCLHEFKHNATVFGFDTFAGFPKRRSVLDAHADPEDEYRDRATVQAQCGLLPQHSSHHRRHCEDLQNAGRPPLDSDLL
jgi:hypothetical protein